MTAVLQSANTSTPNGPITPQGPALDEKAAAQAREAARLAQEAQDREDHRSTNELISRVATTKASFTNHVAERFSIVEIAMGIFLSLARRRLDDFAYLMTSCFEWIENKIQDTQGMKFLPESLQKACVKLLVLLGRRNQDGSQIGIEDLNNHREAIIGAGNAITALPALILAKINIVKSLFHFGRPSDRNESSNFFLRTILYLAPLLNTLAMWVSAAGKAAPAEAMQALVMKSGQKIDNSTAVKDDHNMALNSVNEDKLCGMMSAGLVATPILGKIFPKLDKLIENIYAAYISYKSFQNGVKGFRGEAAAAPDQTRYSLTNFDYKLMSILDPCRKWISRILGAKDFSLDTMLSIIRNPEDRNVRNSALATMAA